MRSGFKFKALLVVLAVGATATSMAQAINQSDSTLPINMSDVTLPSIGGVLNMDSGRRGGGTSQAASDLNLRLVPELSAEVPDWIINSETPLSEDEKNAAQSKWRAIVAILRSFRAGKQITLLDFRVLHANVGGLMRLTSKAVSKLSPTDEGVIDQMSDFMSTMSQVNGFVKLLDGKFQRI